MNSSEIKKEEKTNPIGWYVVQSEPNRERVAKHYLEGNGFDVYLPMRMCAPTSKAVMTPLFPRHLFVRLDMDGTTWPRVFTTIGVAAVLTHTTRNGPRPGRVPEHIVDRFRAEEVDGLIRLAGAQSKGKPLPFKAGDQVRVACGNQFGELDGIFLERVDANRVVILLSLLGREWRAPVRVSSLRGS